VYWEVWGVLGGVGCTERCGVYVCATWRDGKPYLSDTHM
jgi:hypothetical protein